MTKRKKPPNEIHKDLRTPKYKMRVIKDKRKKILDNIRKKDTTPDLGVVDDSYEPSS